MIEIPLTRNKVTVVDDCDAHLETITKNRWCFSIGKGKKTGYAVKTMTLEGKRTSILLHHLIVGRPINGLQVDHINGDGLDNRRENLRIVDARINRQNMKCHRDRTKKSKYVGVYSFNGKKNKWYAQLSYGGKQHHLGMFPTQEKAHQAHERALSIFLKNQSNLA